MNSLGSIEAQRNNSVLKWSDPQKITETKKWFKVTLTLKICWIKYGIFYILKLKRTSQADITSAQKFCVNKSL